MYVCVCMYVCVYASCMHVCVCVYVCMYFLKFIYSACSITVILHVLVISYAIMYYHLRILPFSIYKIVNLSVSYFALYSLSRDRLSVNILKFFYIC